MRKSIILTLFYFFYLSQAAAESKCNCYYNVVNNGWGVAEIYKSDNFNFLVAKKIFKPYVGESKMKQFCLNELTYLANIPYCQIGTISAGMPKKNSQLRYRGHGRLLHSTAILWNVKIQKKPNESFLRIFGESSVNHVSHSWFIHAEVRHDGNGKWLRTLNSNIIPEGAIGQFLGPNDRLNVIFGNVRGDDEFLNFNLVSYQ